MNSVLGISVVPDTKSQIMRKVMMYLNENKFAHIVSLNPEIVMEAQKSVRLRKILNAAEIQLIDGVGMVLAGKVLGVPIGERMTGVDLMRQLLEMAAKKKLRVLILGGYGTVAEELTEQLQKKYKTGEFKGFIGYTDVKDPSSIEEKNVQKILSNFKPDLVFVAFGAPAQEFWIEDHKQFLKNSVCMSVGGAVDFLVGKVQRAPFFMQKLGLEWLFRLIIQPWRWNRQLKLLSFLKLVFQQSTH